MATSINRNNSLKYYKNLATSLLLNRGNLSYATSHEDDSVPFHQNDKVREIEVLRHKRAEVVSDISFTQKQELCGIMSELATAQGCEYIMVFSKYLQAVRNTPSTWEPNADRLNKDYSEFKRIFSGFIEAFSEIGFMFQHINRKSHCYNLFNQLLQMAATISDGDKELFIKLTKRMSVVDSSALVMDLDMLKLIKALRVVLMAMQLGRERSRSTFNKVVSIINPKLSNYTIFNEEYVDEILRLSNKSVSRFLLTALIKEERPDIQISDISLLINEMIKHHARFQDLVRSYGVGAC